MWLLIAEMVLALGAIVFIMWWTMRARVDHAVPPDEPLEQETLEQTTAQPTDAPSAPEPSKPQV
ncbi:MAG TPA: hypothetical protein VGE55_02240 [Limnobacter sp.]|uniref:hypothetical protein n=1 Tax=Limnobacter sp. TaxID=2003368 RepID=UPI002ED7CC3C